MKKQSTLCHGIGFRALRNYLGIVIKNFFFLKKLIEDQKGDWQSPFSECG